ncbi:MAG TPA: polysaccharide lyase family protein [Chthonomonas sp.]|uniref:polysaccharide lyase family protein n=1 Tax=Chthonomonas sp. TaxID=2282153 RepID=UPI002B4B5C7F|nr:polysaccharide lyase family protein [Chthonomonas sp.]HLH78860.1 polysaccharide lyase family protein [Chthonomonas sp.]
MFFLCSLRRLRRTAQAGTMVALMGWPIHPALARQAPPVTLAETPRSFVLSNGILTVQIDKYSGNIASWKYKGLELMSRGQGYWSQVGSTRHFGAKRMALVRVSPAASRGAEVEVAVRALYDPQNPSDQLPADVEWRYTLFRGDSWLYASALWHHPASYPFFSVGEARMCLKLNPAVFDFLVVDARRQQQMATGYDWDHGIQLNLKEARRLTTGVRAGEVEHKYDYAAVLYQTPAYGWASTHDSVGFWMINPSFEYLSGGPTRPELTGHVDTVLLNMWLSSHYGGSWLAIDKGEAWTKFVGPFVLYVNSGSTPQAMWRDALHRAALEKAKWPYRWVDDPNYPSASQRGAADGQIVVRDPYHPHLQVQNMWVGLTAPDYPAHQPSGFPPMVDWQRDAAHYQFWVQASPNGSFHIPNVRPGRYTLHAFATGVLGEFEKTDISIGAGETLHLGRWVWVPKYYGQPLWEIGVPDRTAQEFHHGDHYWQWGLYYLYPKEFPHGVQYVIGKSDWHRDWNYCQPPIIYGDPEWGTVWHVGNSVWSIIFTLPKALEGKAYLRLAFCGSRQGTHITVLVNGKVVGDTGPLPNSGVMHRDGIQGYWCERDVAFDASLLHAGQNVIQLKLEARDWPQGVLYDYLRLEVATNRVASAKARPLSASHIR